MDNQPEALRLADALDVALMSTELTNTAAEVLRRLHAENERLRAALGEPEWWVRDDGEITSSREEAESWAALHAQEPELWGKPQPLYALKAIAALKEQQ